MLRRLVLLRGVLLGRVLLWWILLLRGVLLRWVVRLVLLRRVLLPLLVRWLLLLYHLPWGYGRVVRLRLLLRGLPLVCKYRQQLQLLLSVGGQYGVLGYVAHAGVKEHQPDKDCSHS
jgi:hypothetical protein